jgi:hypothetical protein
MPPGHLGYVIFSRNDSNLIKQRDRTAGTICPMLSSRQVLIRSKTAVGFSSAGVHHSSHIVRLQNLILSRLNMFMTAFIVYWSEFLATDPEVRFRFPALPDYLRSSGSGTGSTQLREYN